MLAIKLIYWANYYYSSKAIVGLVFRSVLIVMWPASNLRLVCNLSESVLQKTILYFSMTGRSHTRHHNFTEMTHLPLPKYTHTHTLPIHPFPKHSQAARPNVNGLAVKVAISSSI